MKTKPDWLLMLHGACIGVAVGLHAQHLLTTKFDAALLGVMVGWVLYIIAFFLGAWRVSLRQHGTGRGRA